VKFRLAQPFVKS